MRYAEILDKIIKEEIDIAKFVIADACNWIFDFDYAEEQYEELCKKVERVWIGDGNGISIDEIVYAINEYIKDGNTVDDILKMHWLDVHEMCLSRCGYYAN